MKPEDEEKPGRLPTVSGPNLGPANLSTPPEVEGYEILKALGEGGMGVVYLARQKEPIERQVALKIIKAGMDSKQIIARFEAERQALALLDHPNIAHVYDAGTTKDGHPYFSMEYIDGPTITEYCDQQQLNINERLELFIQVCEGVQHAHQKGIIHRDVKPSNVLVYTQAEKPLTKIIDFGVAKAITASLTEQTVSTEHGKLVGTPEYMSPEQATAGQDIDTRTDIYSLGIVLYELLTGSKPFDPREFREGEPDQILSLIREKEPKRPSTWLCKTPGAELTSVAQLRRIDFRTLVKRLNGDLDWITLKAIEKDRIRRYQTAHALVEDIVRHLSHENVTAGRPTTIYLMKKFIRRHRTLVTSTAAVLVILIAGIIVSTVLAIGERRARIELQSIAKFLRNDFLGSVARGKSNEITLNYALDTASEKLQSKKSYQPLTKAWLHETLGWTYLLLGELNNAEGHLDNAQNIYLQCYGKKHPDSLGVRWLLGWVYEDLGRYEDAKNTWADVLKLSKNVLEEQSVHEVKSALAFIHVRLGKYDQAESIYNEILQTENDKDSKQCLSLHSLCCLKCDLARLYAAQGLYNKAEDLLCETLAVAEWDSESTWRLIYTKSLGEIYRMQGCYDEAEELLVELLDIAQDTLGEDHMRTVSIMYNIAQLHTDQGHFKDANDIFIHILDIGKQRLEGNHPAILDFVNSLAVLRTKQKQYDEAESLFKEALEGRQQKMGEDHPNTLESKNDLAELYKECSRYTEAERLLLDAVKGRQLKLGDAHPNTRKSLNNLIGLYEAWNKPQEAEKFRLRLRRDMTDGGAVGKQQGAEARHNKTERLHNSSYTPVAGQNREQRDSNAVETEVLDTILHMFLGLQLKDEMSLLVLYERHIMYNKESLIMAAERDGPKIAEAVRDFCTKNEPGKGISDMGRLSIKHDSISETEFNSPDFSWFDFRKEHPIVRDIGLIRLGRPGFSSDRTVAFGCISRQTGPFGGHGRTYAITKVNGKWAKARLNFGHG